ncbi:DUF4157 domain-containing protein [Thermococcus sp. Bubb.Bath]|uniref:eCIS core domain-containing protein n=1 Tax=Thermococcus sp. Bubb.Bath TaxID=1638242 RepID=UPI00143B0EA2|nr:DUF4157 domain-containing protein [Thermococcus sp. Bubb.Bath]NJF25245.1 DUF4157 domain-containing protein [Thermococcus sp. Bubb.Bath]
MKPKTFQRLSALALVIVMAASLLAAAQMNSNEGKLRSEINSILQSVERIRGLQFKEPPQIIILTKAQAREEFKPGKPDIQRMRLEEDVYKMSLLLPPDYPYVHAEVEQSLGWIAMTMGDKIYILKENFEADPDTARRVIAHESVHVLQKQWFNAPYGGPTLDTTKAIQAAIEGDADLVADLYCNETGIPIHKITDLYTRDPVTSLGIFPYVFGDRFVAYLYRKGGWKLVNGMYYNLPNTTKVVMFPELYLQNWTPVDVRANLSSYLPKSNFTVRYSGRMGAYYVFLIYWGHDAEKEKAMEMARSWEGDWLVMGDINESGKIERVLFWEVLFSDDEHAKDFGEFLKGIAKNDNYANFSVEVKGREVLLTARKELVEVPENANMEINMPSLWENLR